MDNFKKATNKNIVITGFMGSGKSTVGKLVAVKLERTFIDTDQVIESEAGMWINDIFINMGEDHFRNLEYLLIKKISNSRNNVIATGGGSLLNENNANLFSESSIIFCLTARVDVLKKRLSNYSHRPLLQNDNLEKKIEALLNDRQSDYNRLPNQIDTSESKPEEIAAIIINSYRILIPEDGNENKS